MSLLLVQFYDCIHVHGWSSQFSEFFAGLVQILGADDERREKLGFTTVLLQWIGFQPSVGIGKDLQPEVVGPETLSCAVEFLLVFCDLVYEG